ncbi:M15 family metallopeptidase [Leptospira meyeri]|nr:M15 family metallopeptidase [Leptospira meyeri]PKA24593.1 peptidase M15 [Leptospira sp. mixed culture ATI2-C-A1]TGL50967.1 D-alanyl-D-alanine carboxypeptidase family protein [Leptospira meyeri]TGM24419.1 D-alanyl-D-alanine carboxypeptidase family protein [Leptospira meyeri]TGM64374.1 D-alanyl-D-alanine carboxypeptidase family protein [Leptospira meyeri]TGM67158.1 D-alanyl-D-alanine carboxypeptidase family protein [Leptospira meyeri]
MFRTKYISLLLVSFFLVCGEKPVKPSKTDLYLGIEKTAYLTGKFNSPGPLAPVILEENEKEHFLRPDVKKALHQMINDFEDSKPVSYKQHIFLVSSFRNFSHQKGIWESKFTGKKAMRLPINGKSQEEIIGLILEFSSAPGTSRHHWGTDFDINALDNAYFEEKGKGKILYDWLKQNASKYGFCQPYSSLSTRNNKGYQEEKWHWSYAPISNQLTKEWIKGYSLGEIQLTGSFLGAEVLGDRALDYVRSINPDCEKIQSPSL